MNIKELKSNIEKAVKIILIDMVGNDVKVDVNYLLDNNIINVLLVKENNNEKDISVAQYQFSYETETSQLTFGAILRHIIMDQLSVHAVRYEPIFINEQFIASIKNGIRIGVERTDDVLAEQERREAVENADKDTSEEPSNEAA